MTCKECLYESVCFKRATRETLSMEGLDLHCSTFKNKADWVEVKCGKWKIKTDEYDCEYMMCSVCKEEFYPANEDTVDTTPNYCMNCGAKMNGKRKEE